MTDFLVGRVGRIVAGRDRGFFIEVDDDTQRPGGTGGWYVLLWNEGVGYDDWFESVDDVGSAFEGRQVDWLSEAESEAIPGRHRHDSD